uniref:Uncharacterized protein n=1 Tax=Peromyscus maniculatus bairdii TaxID=230844 RepID=A0A8C8UQ33_PERMB
MSALIILPACPDIWKTRLCAILFLLILPAISMARASPHAIKKLTWQVISQTGETVWQTAANHAPFSWWPYLTPDFCQLAAGGPVTWTSPCGTFHGTNPATMTAHGCVSPTARCRLAQSDFYVCPKDGRSRAVAARCRGYEEFFCAQWGCETTGAAHWHPSSSWDLITVTRGYLKPSGRPCYSSATWKPQTPGLSLPLNITFTTQGKSNTGWTSGKTWGLRWCLGGKDKGVSFKILLKIEPVNAVSVGPNPVLPNSHNKILAPAKGAITPRPTPGSTSTPPLRNTFPVIPHNTVPNDGSSTGPMWSQQRTEVVKTGSIWHAAFRGSPPV